MVDSLTLSANGCTVTGGPMARPLRQQGHHWALERRHRPHGPLGNAHRSGGSARDSTTKHGYANDFTGMDHLIAVTDKVNQFKGDKDPEAWKPSYTGDWCRYATD
jgi:hypothetical protein